MGPIARQSSTPASIAVVLGLLLSAVPARGERASWIIEEDSSHPEVMFSFLGGWYLTGFGGEFRFAFPIAPDGAIDYLNESFAMEVGVGYQYFLDSARDFGRLTFPLTVRWDFHLTDLWTVYGALGAAGGFPFDRPHKDIFGYHGYIWPVAAVGCFLHLARGWTSARRRTSASWSAWTSRSATRTRRGHRPAGRSPRNGARSPARFDRSGIGWHPDASSSPASERALRSREVSPCRAGTR